MLNYARDTATLINLIILGLMLAYIKKRRSGKTACGQIVILSID
jgi:hypothetical protein